MNGRYCYERFTSQELYGSLVAEENIRQVRIDLSGAGELFYLITKKSPKKSKIFRSQGAIQIYNEVEPVPVGWCTFLSSCRVTIPYG